jgi:hypothetical protein
MIRLENRIIAVAEAHLYWHKWMRSGAAVSLAVVEISCFPDTVCRG